MKKGLILYVTEGKEEVRMQDWPDFGDQLSSLGACDVCLATSEDEIAYGWWRLLTRGMHQISCMKAAYDPARDKIEPYGAPLRICG